MLGNHTPTDRPDAALPAPEEDIVPVTETVEETLPDAPDAPDGEDEGEDET